MVLSKSGQELEIMKQGGKILAEVLKNVFEKAKTGVTTKDLDNLAEQEIRKRGGEPSFKRVKGYRWSICSCVNEEVVHGIPSQYILQDGDILSIDCGVYYKGYHTDAAKTVKIGRGNKEIDRFLRIGRQALEKAIRQVKIGNYICDISTAIQNTVEKAGYSVVRSLVGHGIGIDLHEEPEIPCFVNQERKKTAMISIGMVLAIEVIYNKGNHEVVAKKGDEWTIVTKDGKIAGLFEATVAATPKGFLVLTGEV